MEKKRGRSRGITKRGSRVGQGSLAARERRFFRASGWVLIGFKGEGEAVEGGGSSVLGF